MTCAMCHPNWESKLNHSNSVTFDAKKAKETLMMRLSGNTATITEAKRLIRLENVHFENSLKPMSFENMPNCPLLAFPFFIR